MKEWENPDEWRKRNLQRYKLRIYKTDTDKYSVKDCLNIGVGKIFDSMNDAIEYCKSINRDYEIIDEIIKEWG